MKLQVIIEMIRVSVPATVRLVVVVVVAAMIIMMMIAIPLMLTTVMIATTGTATVITMILILMTMMILAFSVRVPRSQPDIKESAWRKKSSWRTVQGQLSFPANRVANLTPKPKP